MSARYTYAKGCTTGTIYADSMLDAAEHVAGHPYVNLVKNPAGAWCIEERVRTTDGTFKRRVIGTIARAA